MSEFMSKEILYVEDIAEILHIKPNTIQSKRWQEKTGCPMNKKGKRLYSIGKNFREWLVN